MLSRRPSFLVLACALAVAAAPLPAAAADMKPGTLTVTGEGESAVTPDMAVVSLSVVREDKTAREALTADNKAMSAVLDAMKKTGVADRDLQTGALRIEPRYVYPSDKNNLKAPKIVSYQVTNTLTVRIRDLSKVGEILDQSVTLGVNSGGGVTFTNQHPKEILHEARSDAMHDALARARTLTEAAGIGIGRILAISEISDQPRPVPMARASFAAKAAPEAVPVATGENTYHVRVKVTFELKQ